MTMNGAVLPVLAMYIVAAEEQVSQRLIKLCDFGRGVFEECDEAAKHLFSLPGMETPRLASS
jgi:methylmalonyl-CoA mutase N-terminal domain/subunit